MKTAILIILALILLSGCTDREYMIDSRLSPYLQTFYYEGVIRGHQFDKDNLILSFKKLSNYHGGECREQDKLFGEDQIIIYIDIDEFEKSDELSREMIIFHELGHGLLRRDHEQNVPSIMHPNCIYKGYVMPGEPFLSGLNYRTQFIDELFN